MTLYSCFSLLIYEGMYRYGMAASLFMHGGPIHKAGVCTALWVRWTLQKPGVKVVPTLLKKLLSYKGKTCLTKSSLKKIELQLRKQKNLKNNLFHVLELNKHNTSCTVLVLTCFLVVDSKVGWKSIKQVLLRLSYNTMYTLQGDQDKSVSTSCLIPLIFSSYWLLPLVIITVSSRSRHSKLFVLLRYTKKTVEWRRRQTTLCVLWRTILCARTKVYKGLLLLLLVKNNNFLRWQRDILTGVSNSTLYQLLLPYFSDRAWT